MQIRIKRRYDKFTRETAFFDVNQDDFAPASPVRTHVGTLKQVVLDMDKAKVGQGGGTAIPKEILIDGVQLDLGLIRGLAIAFDLDEPGFLKRFPLAENNETSILTTAATYLKELAITPTDTPAQITAKTALVARFVAHELPADFVEELQADLQSIQGKDTEFDDANVEGVENTAALGRLSKQGMKESVYLNAIMRVKYKGNSDKLRGWESASHLERAPKKAKPTTNPLP